MRKIFCLVCLLPGLAVAQYKTSIGIKLLPGVTNTYLLTQDPGFSRFALSGGVELRHRLYKNLYVDAGLICFDRGFRHRYNRVDTNGMPLGKYDYRASYLSLTLPVSLVYKMDGFYLGAGSGISYIIRSREHLNGSLQSREFPKGWDKMAFTAQCFAGYEYMLNRRLILSAEVFYSIRLGKDFHNYGLGIGLHYIPGKFHEVKTHPFR